MDKKIIAASAILMVAIAFFALIDLGFFWSLIADGVMDSHTSGGRYQYSLIRQASCSLFSPEKTYRPIGDHAWMSEVMGGYWCMSNEDIKKFPRGNG